MKIYDPLTEKRPDETFEQFYERDRQAKIAKAEWERNASSRRMWDESLGRPSSPEPDWNGWDPPSSASTGAAFPPITQPPPWLRDRLPPRATWQTPVPIAYPSGTGPTTPQPASIFAEGAPAQPLVRYPDGRVESLALRAKDVLTALTKGADIAMDGGRWVVVGPGQRVLGPIGAIGSLWDLWQFSVWASEKIAPGWGGMSAWRVEYQPFDGSFLLKHTDGRTIPVPRPPQ